MCKKDIIKLDARLVGVINIRAFHAELDNGHRFVAFLRDGDVTERPVLQVNTKVRVKMSPFDMSSGQIIFE